MRDENLDLSSRRVDGFKLSADLYRKGGERVLWLDGHEDTLTRKLVAAIRAAGFKAWRTRDQVWVRRDDAFAIEQKGFGSSWIESNLALKP